MFKSVIYIGLETINHGINLVVEKLENLKKLLNYDITIIKQEPLTDLQKILEIIEQTHQLLCRIEIEGKEVLIPLHEETIKKIDRAARQVIVELPEGLLEIYL
jgi:16S rRNA processing protein RimM